MNTAVKVLIIFVTIASLSFMALTGAVTLGGPNWFGKSQDLKEYTFESTTGETTTYKVTHRPSGEAVPVSQSEIHAAAVIAALKNQKTRQTARSTELDDLIRREENRVKLLKQWQGESIEQLEARTQEYLNRLQSLNDTIDTRNEEIDNLTKETFALNQSLGDRREDVLRLRDQLALVRTDRNRLVEERGELEDILVLLNASIDQLERRTRQLQNQN